MGDPGTRLIFKFTTSGTNGDYRQCKLCGDECENVIATCDLETFCIKL